MGRSRVGIPAPELASPLNDRRRALQRVILESVPDYSRSPAASRASAWSQKCST